MKGIAVTLGGAAACLASLAAWCYIAPAAGSGWILLVAFLGCLGLLDSIGSRSLNLLAGLLITPAAGAAWYFHSTLPNAGWLLLLTVLVGLTTFDSLSRVVKGETKTK